MRLLREASLAALLGLLLNIQTASAETPDLSRVQGAWVAEGSQCAAVFRRQGNSIHFARPGATDRDGVLIRGNRIEDTRNRCTIKRAKHEAGHSTMLLACFSGLLVENMLLKLRVIDENTIVRVIDDFPDAGKRWQRCRS